MRTTFRQWIEWSHTDQADFFERNFGTQGMWNSLRKELDWPWEDLRAMVQALVESKTEVEEFMGGKEVVDMLPGQIKDPMILLSAMRLLLHKSGVDWISVEERDQMYEAGVLRKQDPLPRKGQEPSMPPIYHGTES